MATDSKNKLSRRKAIQFAGLGAIASAVGVGSASANTTSAGKSIDILVDFPDTDYDEVMIGHADCFAGLNAELLMRRVAFIDREGKIPEVFARVHPHEERANAISRSAVVITPCVKTVLASIKAGAVSVYVCHGHSPHGIEEDMAELGITVVSLTDEASLTDALMSASNQSG